MDSLHHRLDDAPLTSPDSHTPRKRPLPADDVSHAKRVRTVEVPAIYSDAVRKKLASTSRTGQACDRCKERKMKCDTDPIACQPCRQKSLRCYTTDRVTGQSRERGQSDRAESELQMLRDQNAAYRRKYGPLDAAEYQVSAGTPISESGNEKLLHVQPPPPERDKTDIRSSANIPDSRYIGWPAPEHTEPISQGPVNGTVVDVLDGYIDIADFPCESMDEYPKQHLNIFNMSRTSVTNTMTGYQQITDPRFPSREQSLSDARAFLLIMYQYMPVVHSPSFIHMVQRIYDQPTTVTQAERVQLSVILATIEQQCGTRNHQQAAEKFEQSHYHFHYALTYYRELIREKSLASMQALALMLLYLRNLPKPGYTWSFAHNVLIKTMDLGYHRDPDKIKLPPAEDNLLAKELRKRVFHSILGICVTTGCRVGRPAPWQFSHMDVPLPMAVKDSELSETGLISPLSGLCDFRPCLQLAKLLPLLTEMYNYVTSVRRPELEYLRIVEALHTKIDAWRRDWDECIRNEDKTPNLMVASLLMDTWAAEYGLNLYHPSLCPTRSPEIMDRHLDICHKQAQRLLKSFHILSSKYKGVDFTWHSTVAYALGFGLTLGVYQRRKAPCTITQFESMRNELKGWMSLMAYADLVLRTRNHLQRSFEPRVQRLESEYRELLPKYPSNPTQHPQGSPNPMSTGLRRSLIKPDPSPQQSPVSAVMNGPEAHRDLPPHTPTAMSYSQQPMLPTAQVWDRPTPYGTPSDNTTTTYNTFPANVTQYSPLPTTLAPILNDQPNGYMTYASGHANPQNEMMMFQPAHYTDGPTAMMWPMITLSQHDQHPQQR